MKSAALNRQKHNYIMIYEQSVKMKTAALNRQKHNYIMIYVLSIKMETAALNRQKHNYRIICNGKQFADMHLSFETRLNKLVTRNGRTCII